MDIQSIMTPNPKACPRNASLEQIAQMMRDEDIGEVPVVDSDGGNRKLLGVITDRDIVVRAVAEGENPSRITAEEDRKSTRLNSSHPSIPPFPYTTLFRSHYDPEPQGLPAQRVARADRADDARRGHRRSAGRGLRRREPQTSWRDYRSRYRSARGSRRRESVADHRRGLHDLAGDIVWRECIA